MCFCTFIIFVCGCLSVCLSVCLWPCLSACVLCVYVYMCVCMDGWKCTRVFASCVFVWACEIWVDTMPWSGTAEKEGQTTQCFLPLASVTHVLVAQSLSLSFFFVFLRSPYLCLGSSFLFFSETRSGGRRGGSNVSWQLH
uniref:Uncharacterized protein n=1 Tax=Astyanax mexicanus TaxID=7994 RepID=A0A8B9KX48_ASTMX